MTPEIMDKIRLSAEREVAEIVEAWPTAKIRWTLDGLAAVAMIQSENFTYIIEVDGDITRSLWVSHPGSIGAGSGHAPNWTGGWVD